MIAINNCLEYEKHTEATSEFFKKRLEIEKNGDIDNPTIEDPEFVAASKEVLMDEFIRLFEGG